MHGESRNTVARKALAERVFIWLQGEKKIEMISVYEEKRYEQPSNEQDGSHIGIVSWVASLSLRVALLSLRVALQIIVTMSL